MLWLLFLTGWVIELRGIRRYWSCDAYVLFVFCCAHTSCFHIQIVWLFVHLQLKTYLLMTVWYLWLLDGFLMKIFWYYDAYSEIFFLCYHAGKGSYYGRENKLPPVHDKFISGTHYIFLGAVFASHADASFSQYTLFNNLCSTRQPLHAWSWG